MEEGEKVEESVGYLLTGGRNSLFPDWWRHVVHDAVLVAQHWKQWEHHVEMGKCCFILWALIVKPSPTLQGLSSLNSRESNKNENLMKQEWWSEYIV